MLHIGKNLAFYKITKYFFAVSSRCRYIDASVVLREFSVKWGASQPHLLRITLLRKQVKQLLVMNDNEIKMIVKLMGHSHTAKSIRTKRTPLPTNILGKISLIG
jgi:dTDP-D-glucose 4,6-dehydratase